MLVAEDQNDKEIEADSGGYGATPPYHCPACRWAVTLRIGKINIPHFAHRPGFLCEHTSRESEIHRRCKIAIYKALLKSPDVSKCKMERGLGTVRPDVSCKIRDSYVAFEVQISALTVEQIMYRTEQYAKKKIAVLWLLPCPTPMAGEKYALRGWEKWINATYFGRVYYWTHDDMVMPVHMDPYMLAKEEFDGNGGYCYPSKRFRTPNHGVEISVLDFKSTMRDAWHGGSISVPRCRLWMDSLKRWW